jgi:hypothetical protein
VRAAANAAVNMAVCALSARRCVCAHDGSAAHCSASAAAVAAQAVNLGDDDGQL